MNTGMNGPLSVPTVEAMTCGNLTAPTNGAVTASGMNLSDTANYSCDTGYSLEGSAWRVCQSNGSWNGTDPTCTSELFLIV